MNVNLKGKIESYRSAEPFPHLILDDFLEPDIAEAVHKEFPGEDSLAWIWNSDDKNSKKSMCSDVSIIRSMPTIYKLLKDLNSRYMRKNLAELINVDFISADKFLAGAGLHQITNGGFLSIHADFNVAEQMPDRFRKLNLILYLNKDWKTEYNGQLELWSPDLSKCVKTIEPIFNRAVIFDTQPENSIAYHGHPKPLNVPEGVVRKSIALYYYVQAQPNTILKERHKTIYK